MGRYVGFCKCVCTYVAMFVGMYVCTYIGMRGLGG